MNELILFEFYANVKLYIYIYMVHRIKIDF